MDKSIEARRVIDLAFGSGILSRDGINYAICCPSCNDVRKDKRKLIVRLDDGRYHCWVCGLKGVHIKSLIGKFRPDMLERTQRLRFQKSTAVQLELEETVELPKASMMLGLVKHRDPDMIATKKYLDRRGLTEADITRWRILGLASGKFRRRALIPSYDDTGRLNYYVARAIDSDVYLKYKNPKVSKENIIFNEIDVDWTRPIILVEGVFDAMKCPENAIPILGSSLSKRSRLFRKIVENQSTCIVALDPDLKLKAFKLADLLLGAGCEVKITFAPDGKDMGDLCKQRVAQLISMMRISYKISKMRSGSVV